MLEIHYRHRYKAGLSTSDLYWQGIASVPQSHSLLTIPSSATSCGVLKQGLVGEEAREWLCDFHVFIRVSSPILQPGLAVAVAVAQLLDVDRRRPGGQDPRGQRRSRKNDPDRGKAAPTQTFLCPVQRKIREAFVRIPLAKGQSAHLHDPWKAGKFNPPFFARQIETNTLNV